jgi:hypothetical protein
VRFNIHAITLDTLNATGVYPNNHSLTHFQYVPVFESPNCPQKFPGDTARLKRRHEFCSTTNVCVFVRLTREEDEDSVAEPAFFAVVAARMNRISIYGTF